MKHCVRCTMKTIPQGKLDPAPPPCTDNAYKLLPNAEKTKTPGRTEMGGQVFITNTPFISGSVDLILGCLHLFLRPSYNSFIFCCLVCLKDLSMPDSTWLLCALWHFRFDSNWSLAVDVWLLFSDHFVRKCKLRLFRVQFEMSPCKVMAGPETPHHTHLTPRFSIFSCFYGT